MVSEQRLDAAIKVLDELLEVSNKIEYRLTRKEQKQIEEVANTLSLLAAGCKKP